MALPRGGKGRMTRLAPRRNLRHDQTTNRRKVLDLGDGAEGDVRVHPSSNRLRAFAALATAAALSGCAAGGDSWFSKPLNPFGNNLGYTYADLGEARRDRFITANDLVDANGACPTGATPQAQPAPGAPDAPPQMEGGIGIGMTECEVVMRLGQPTAVNLSRNPHGDRNAVMTYKTGPRPGAYRFVGGRLAEMDRVDEPAPPPAPPKKKGKKPPKNNNAT